MVLLGLVAPPVGANYGRVSARITCDRAVNWTASASTEGDAEDRTNRRVLVEYRATRGQEPVGDWTAAGPEGSFSEDNDFRFSGTFQLPASSDSVDLRVTPLSDWGSSGDGEAPGGPRFSRAALPSGCQNQPIVADVAGDCGNGGARVTVRNIGAEASAVVVAADGVPVRQLQVAPDGTEELIVPVLEGRPAAVRVAAGDFVVAESTVDGDCGVTGPAAVIVERCAGRQAVVFATLGDAPSGTADIRVGGAIVHTADLEPGTVLQRTLELPPSGATPVSVEIAGTTYTSGEIGSCSGPLAGAVSCGSGGAQPCGGEAAGQVPPPPPPPPPTSIELDEPMLPRTGPWERAVALTLGGALLLAGGLAVAGRDRRRPRPSPVAAAIAPYRQRWWDD